MRVPRAVVLLAMLLACAGAAQQEEGTDARRIQALIDAGRLDDAERLARAAGPALAVPLAELLAWRGRPAEAESLLARVVREAWPDTRSAIAGLAELALRRGDRREALRRAAVLADEHRLLGAAWSAADLVAAGRAYAILGLESPQATRAALAAFDAAAARDAADIESRLRAADLLLDRYNAPDARASYQEVLALSPGHPRALLGLARVLSFEGSSAAADTARRSLARNPTLVPAHLLLARLHLEAESYDSAAAAARRALAVDSTALAAWGTLGAVAWLRGDSAAWHAARAQADRLHPAPAEFFAEVGEAAARHRRYAAAVTMAEAAVERDPESPRALGVLGTNLLRTGRISDGRRALERAFARDPFHVWNKNTLDLLDQLDGFVTVRTERFEFVAPAEEAELLVLYLGPLLEEAYDTLARRYAYRPPTPIRLELFRHHADFSVRTVGLAGLGALGVSFGTVLAMDAPSARGPGEFNWGSTAWHELAHTFTLGVSGHRVPRWLSEGLSVLEERRARPGWGADVSVEFLAAYKADRVLPVSRINEGFVRPRHPAELQFSYYQASLVCELIESEFGERALGELLRAYGEGLDTPAALRRVLNLDPGELDRRFDRWMRERFRTGLAGLDAWHGEEPVSGGFVSGLVRGRQLLSEGQAEAARRELERAQQLFPEYAGQGSPAWDLARLFKERGDLREAIAQLERITRHDETALDANMLEARWRLEAGDSAGAMAPLERLIWMAPYAVETHQTLAALADARGDLALALRERQAVVALRPADRVEARYQLARAFWRAGRAAEARREILQVLELAPGFEKAHELLLALRGGGTEETP